MLFEIPEKNKNKKEMSQVTERDGKVVGTGRLSYLRHCLLRSSGLKVSV